MDAKSGLSDADAALAEAAAALPSSEAIPESLAVSVPIRAHLTDDDDAHHVIDGTVSQLYTILGVFLDPEERGLSSSAFLSYVPNHLRCESLIRAKAQSQPIYNLQSALPCSCLHHLFHPRRPLYSSTFYRGSDQSGQTHRPILSYQTTL